MRFTSNDVVFSILHSCSDGLRADKLVYYMYAFQKAGLSLKYRYRVQANGITCRDIAAALNNLIALNKIACEDGMLELLPEGALYYNNVVLTYSEWEKVCGVKAMLDGLSEDELFLICVTDIVMSDMIRRSGVEGLEKGRATVEGTISNLSREYSPENFDAALYVMRQIKEC